MGNSNRKIYTGKSSKKSTRRVIIKNNDPFVKKLDLKIRCAKSVHSLVKRVFQMSFNSRSGKYDRPRDAMYPEERIMKHMLDYSKPINVAHIELTKSEKPKPEPKYDRTGKTNGLIAITKNNLLNAVFSGTVATYDQEYRNKSVISRLFKSHADLLPSPATFGLHNAGFNEANKFLQEKALILMELFVKHYIDLKSTPNYIKKTDDVLKCCSQCKSDFSPAWFSVDIRKTVFICDRCNCKRKRQEFSKLNILSLYPDIHATIPTTTITLGPLQKNVSIKTSSFEVNKNKSQPVAVCTFAVNHQGNSSVSSAPKYDVTQKLVERSSSSSDSKLVETTTAADTVKPVISKPNATFLPRATIYSGNFPGASPHSAISTASDAPNFTASSKNLPRLILNTTSAPSPFYVRSSMNRPSNGPPSIDPINNYPVQNFQLVARTPRTYYLPLNQNTPTHRTINYNTYHYYPNNESNAQLHHNQPTNRGGMVQYPHSILTPVSISNQRPHSVLTPISNQHSHSVLTPISVHNQRPYVYRAPGLQVLGYSSNNDASQNVQQVKNTDMFISNRK